MKKINLAIIIFCLLLTITPFVETNAMTNTTQIFPNESIELNKEIVELKNKEVNKYLEEDSFTIQSSGGNAVQLAGYYQLNNYYCGPASVQNVMQAIGYGVISQHTLASSLGTSAGSGTYVYRIVNYLNQNTSLYWAYASVFSSDTNYYNFSNALVYGIDHNQPLILHTKPYILDNRYDIDDGHYLVGYGYEWGSSGGSSESNILYFDPYEPFGGFKKAPIDKMITAIKNNAGYFIW